MKSCKTVYSKGRKRKAWKKGGRKNLSNERREHLSESVKRSYYNQSEWLEAYKNSEMYYTRAFDETYVSGFTSENIRDTSDEEELLQSSDEDYEGGEAQGKKDDKKQWKALRTLIVTQLLMH